MEKYIEYKLEDFLLDDLFREWVRSGAVLSGSIWEEVLSCYPEKKEDLDKAIILVREWKRPASVLTNDQMYRDINSILTEAGKREAVRQPLWRRLPGYAAAVLLVLGIAGYLINNRQVYTEDLAVVSETTERVEIINSGNSDKEIDLPDGSLVRLSPGSTIRYSLGFPQETGRSVDLEGEAFFDVERDTLRPFSVHSGGLTTRVLGTSFTVRSGVKDVSVTVNTGKVAVSPAGQESEPIILLPNERVVFHASERKLTKALAEAPVMLDPDELKGRFAFDEEPVGEIFTALEKAYGVPINFDAVILKDCYVTLPFREEPFYQKLDVLCRTIKADYTVTDSGVLIKSEGCD